MRMLGQFFYPSNQLTLLRLVFIPFVILSIVYDRYQAAFVLVLIAGITDGMDGLLARRLGQQTTLGKYLDPIADKLLLNSAFLALAAVGAIPLWLVILVLSRDVIMVTTSVVIILATTQRLFPPSLSGKASTLAQVATVLLTLSALLLPLGPLVVLQQVGVYTAAALTIVSGLQYAWLTAERLRGAERAASQNPQPSEEESHREPASQQTPVGENRVH